MQKRYIAAYIAVALVVTASIMAFFVRPHPSSVELDPEIQELPDLKAHYSLESGLSERVSRSHGLALVLTISEYSSKNAVALESLRSWAQDNFQKNPAFLHENAAPAPTRPHNSIIDAFCYSLFTGPRMLLEDQAMLFLKNQIAMCHTTKAYQSFRADYFDSFGLDRESARMLALYQAERAQSAVGVILSVVYWLLAIAIGTTLHLRLPDRARSTRWQRSLAFFWFSLALFYIIVAWVNNDVSVLVSSIVSALFGLYLRRPIAVSFGEDKGLSLRLLVPNARALTLVTWLTSSLVSMQLLTWMHTGGLENSDPITLIISAITGNFVHDPSTARHYFMDAIGIFWLLTSAWAMWNVYRARPIENVETSLREFEDTLI
jgi:hypothetical protein